ncbi:threonylcarbamoyl-AMP synthase [Candidatus Micrarchaeota archaeon]|nr:threonylcarbamoyl-AMP synthase [Candidatus Micrarchaeota archaeon]MBD3417544.1 threonylcarbamoyl-AMP synthase [Candidatus Micrarchaeota archaeon]
MTEIISLEKEYGRAFQEAKRVLSSGGVLLYPTDTVYGIGGDARNPEVVERIRKIKRREDSVFSVLLGGIGMVKEYAEVEGDVVGAVMDAFPGATTLILKSRKELPVVNKGKIGVRVPEHIFMRKLSLELEMPIVSTSANRSGGKAPAGIGEIEKEIMDEADLVLDGGETLHRMNSSVVDILEKKVKRVGAGEIIF